MRLYNGRYGKCIGFYPRYDGFAWVMEDGSQHFSDSKIGKLFVRIAFFIYVFVRGSF